MTRLTVHATPMVQKPAEFFSRENAEGLLAMLQTAETTTLERKLTARYRSIEYNALAVTLAKLKTLSNVGVLYGKGEAGRYIATHKLDLNVSHLSKVLDQVCGRSAAASDPDGTDIDTSLSTMITKAATSKGPKSAKAASTPISLFKLYVALGTLLVLALMSRALIGWVYSAILKKHGCRIRATLHTNSDDIGGYVTTLSMRGLTLDLPKPVIERFLKVATIGSTFRFVIEDCEFPVTFTHPPDGDGTQLGFKMRTELSYTQLRAFLAKSSVTPTQQRIMRAQ